MLNVKVAPLARHILENIADPEKSLRVIDAAIKAAEPIVVQLGNRLAVHLHHRRDSYELTGFLPYAGYQIDETRVFIEQVYFPGTIMLIWDKELEAGNLKASRLIDIPSLQTRRVLGYQIMRDEGVTIFHLEEWDRDQAISWQDIRKTIAKRLETA